MLLTFDIQVVLDSKVWRRFYVCTYNVNSHCQYDDAPGLGEQANFISALNYRILIS